MGLFESESEKNQREHNEAQERGANEKTVIDRLAGDFIELIGDLMGTDQEHAKAGRDNGQANPSSK